MTRPARFCPNGIGDNTPSRMNPSNLLRLSYWLDTALTIPAGPRMWLLVVLGVIGAALVLVLRKRLGFSRGVVRSLALSGLIIAGVGLGRLFAVPVISWRIWWLAALLIGAVPLGLQQLRWAWRSGFVGTCIRNMAFARDASTDDASPLPFGLFWLGLHGLGLGALIAFNRWPWWSAALIGLAILLPQGLRLLNARSIQVRRETMHDAGVALAPLVVVYASLGIRLLIGGLHYLVDRQFSVPEPWSTIFNPTLALLVMTGYALVLSVWLSRSRGDTAHETADARFVKIGATVLVWLTMGWSLWTGLTLHTRGVSGSDPYAYTQMGVDLATRGTVFHAFPLIRLTYALHIPSEPVVHIGYKLPQDISRTSTTVWPPAYAAFTAAAYRLGGETGVYVLGPVLAVLSLLVVGWLCLHIARRDIGPMRYAIAALTVFFTATSYQQVEWQLIPMADLAAQLFSLLALGLAMQSSEGDSRRQISAGHAPLTARRALLFAALAGVCIGVAFGIRYTQVLIAPAVALALLTTADGGPTTDSSCPRPSVGRRLLPLLICGLFAALAAAPTLLYHQAAFGNPFVTGSDELQHFALATAPATLWRTLEEMFWRREFGFVLPFMLIGAGVLWRYSRAMTVILATYVVILVGFHALYAYLRQRDLLSIFPVLYGLAATGLVWSVWRVGAALWHVRTEDGRRETDSSRPPFSVLRPLLLICLIAFAGFATLQRSIETIILPITRGYDAFGYLVKEQRDAFDLLAQYTPENAVVGSSLNSGAIDLHAHRLAFRPAGWTAEQLLKFVAALEAEATPVYILDDGKELIPVLDALRQQYKLVEVTQLDVPYYFPNSGGSENRRVPLYQVVKS